MKRILATVSIIFLSCYTSSLSMAQELRHPTKADVNNITSRKTALIRNPLMAALDRNRDGTLSTAEIDDSANALRKLDANKDGRIDSDEILQFGAPAQTSIHSETTRPNTPKEASGLSGFTKLIMASDKNKDGKITKAELPERMHGIFQTADANNDGAITEEEAERIGNPAKRRNQRRE